MTRKILLFVMLLGAAASAQTQYVLETTEGGISEGSDGSFGVNGMLNAHALEILPVNSGPYFYYANNPFQSIFTGPLTAGSWDTGATFGPGGSVSINFNNGWGEVAILSGTTSGATWERIKDAFGNYHYHLQGFMADACLNIGGTGTRFPVNVYFSGDTFSTGKALWSDGQYHWMEHLSFTAVNSSTEAP